MLLLLLLLFLLLLLMLMPMLLTISQNEQRVPQPQALGTPSSCHPKKLVHTPAAGCDSSSKKNPAGYTTFLYLQYPHSPPQQTTA